LGPGPVARGGGGGPKREYGAALNVKTSESPVTESYRRPSPYHLGAKRSIGVIGAGQGFLAVI